MRFHTCPRLKKYADHESDYFAEEFRLFTIGEADLFASSLKHFLPELKTANAPLEEANVTLSVSYAYSSKAEYCYIRITSSGIEIHCRDNAGARNAAAILAQLARKTEKGYSFPCGVAEDWPDAAYRGMMLESSGRVWMPMEHLRRYIKEMALARMNVLQFHFMEFNGCTLALDCLPDLPGYGPENRKFSKQSVREMITLGAELGIRVTPFVEVLSHATLLAKHTGICCPGDKDENMFAVCLGQEKTFDVIKTVLAEIAGLFPDDVIHIGADEYDMSAVTPYTAYWDKCPHCQRLAAQKGFTTLRELFLYGIERINRIVNGLGKVMMMWNADIHPGHLPETLDRNILMHFYRGSNDLCREKIYNLNINGYVNEGFSTINSYYPQTYMDIDFYMNAEKLCSWTYLNDPLVKADNRAAVPGGCCCAWDDRSHFVRTIPAAILLFADRLWNAFGDPVEYDGEYGRVMTRILFDGQLPEDANVFACIGNVLPPLNDHLIADTDAITADADQLKKTEAALRQLAHSGNELAAFYEKAVAEAVKQTAAKPAETGPQREFKSFKG